MRARIAALLLILAAALAAGTGPAGALRCAPHPDGSPTAIASGTEQLATGERFFDSYDVAVIGTVTAIRTDEREGGPTYGATEIDLTVAGVLGVDSAPSTTTLSAADPGWLAGYPFAVGASYVVPVDAVSPEGRTNWSMVCDPITEVGDPDATVAELAPLAADSGFVLGRPGDGADAGAGDGADDLLAPVAALGVAGLAGVAVGANVLRRRRLVAP